jgi:hypothetical protein
MNSAARSDSLSSSARIAPYPAPLCETCNIPMWLNGEFRLLNDALSKRREYQCPLCGTVARVRRMSSHRD